MEAPPGFEPGVKDLQSHALPLGYGAVVGRRSLHFSFRRRAKPIGEKFRIRSRLPPLKSKTMFCICFRVRYVSLYESVPCGTEKWSGRRGSNSLPPPWQGGALPDELRPHIARGNSISNFVTERNGSNRFRFGNELPPDAIWCLRSESNQRHAAFQSAALPSELQRHINMVGTTGLEPVTPCL